MSKTPKQCFVMRDGRRVPFSGPAARRDPDGRLRLTGDYYENGYLVYRTGVLGPAYDVPGAEATPTRTTGEYDVVPLSADLMKVARFVGRVLLTLLKVICAIYWLVKIAHGIQDVEQTYSGPNSIANTNANVNRYIAQQSQQR